MSSAWLDEPTAAAHPLPAGDSHAADDGRGTAKASAATVLVSLALDRYAFRVSDDGEPFAVPLSGPKVARPFRGGRTSLRSELAAAYFTATGKAAPQQALTDALLVLEGNAQQLDPLPLHLRVAEHDARLLLDLGDVTGRAVELRPGGWQVLDESPVLFRRTALTGVLPAPERGGDLDELWSVLNVAGRDRPLVLAWLVSTLLPKMPHPILVLRGEQGTGKSTASRMLTGLLDPSPVQVRKPPREQDAWVTAAAGSWVVGVDNVSTVAEWWSDALCRAVTGDGDVRRRLYSDGDLAVFAFRRVVLLNGIDLGAVRDDLGERLLTVELTRIDDRARRLDADLVDLWAVAHPRLLGALLDIACRVLAELPRVVLGGLPRMADFARVLAAVDTALGTRSLDTYLGQAADLAADSVSADPVLATITATIRDVWEGPASLLLDHITAELEHKPGREWPKDARALTAILRRRAPALRRLGWGVDDLGRRGKVPAVRWRLTPPTEASDRQATGQATTATLASDDDVACLPAPVLTCDDVPEASKASKASMQPAHLPLLRFGGERKESGDACDSDVLRDDAETSLASLASQGPCVLCRRSTTRYGDGGQPLCPECRPVACSRQEAVS